MSLQTRLESLAWRIGQEIKAVRTDLYNNFASKSELYGQLSNKANYTHGHVPSSDLVAGGSASSGTYLRGDNVWAPLTGTPGFYEAVPLASTYNVNTGGSTFAQVTGWSLAFTSTSTSDVFEITVSVDAQCDHGEYLVVKPRVGGADISPSQGEIVLYGAMNTGGGAVRSMNTKSYRVSGLAAGNHQATVWASSNVAGSQPQIFSSHSVLSVRRVDVVGPKGDKGDAGAGGAVNVRTLGTGNRALTGLQSISGVTVAEGDRVLLSKQTNAAENGIWVASAGAWSRAPEADSISKLMGLDAYVTEGTWATVHLRNKVKVGDVLGTTAQSWVWSLDDGLYDIPNGLPRLTSGTKVKQDQVPGIFAHVKCATTANITLSGAPKTLPAVTVQAGDRVLVKNQTNDFENGIYVVQTGAWTRAPDADTTDKWHYGALVSCEYWSGARDAGTWRAEFWSPYFTLGEASLTFYSVITMGYGALANSRVLLPMAANTWTQVYHYLGTRNLSVSFHNDSTYQQVELDWRAVLASDNYIEVRSDVPVGNGELRVVFVGEPEE